MLCSAASFPKLAAPQSRSSSTNKSHNSLPISHSYIDDSARLTSSWKCFSIRRLRPSSSHGWSVLLNQCNGFPQALPRDFFLLIFQSDSCDAEPGALAEYILALLKHNVPESEMRRELSGQLDEFLEKGMSVDFCLGYSDATATQNALPLSIHYLLSSAQNRTCPIPPTPRQHSPVRWTRVSRSH